MTTVLYISVKKKFENVESNEQKKRDDYDKNKKINKREKKTKNDDVFFSPFLRFLMLSV